MKYWQQTFTKYVYELQRLVKTDAYTKRLLSHRFGPTRLRAMLHFNIELLNRDLTYEDDYCVDLGVALYKNQVIDVFKNDDIIISGIYSYINSLVNDPLNVNRYYHFLMSYPFLFFVLSPLYPQEVHYWFIENFYTDMAVPGIEAHSSRSYVKGYIWSIQGEWLIDFLPKYVRKKVSIFKKIKRSLLCTK